MFKVDSHAIIDAILNVANHFPSFIDQEGNDKLMAEVTKEELLGVCIVFRKTRAQALWAYC
jgi:hypothetical protein